jgi:hypothetical protein
MGIDGGRRMNLFNLTSGHDIVLCTPEGEHKRTIEPSGYTIRANLNDALIHYMDDLTGHPCYAMEEVGEPFILGKELSISDVLLDLIEKSRLKIFGIIVSRTAADSLMMHYERDDELPVDIMVFTTHKAVKHGNEYKGAAALLYVGDLE